MDVDRTVGNLGMDGAPHGDAGAVPRGSGMQRNKRKQGWMSHLGFGRQASILLGFTKGTPVSPPRRVDTLDLIGRILTAEDDEDPLTAV